MTRLIRVFPRRTRATPDDPLAYVGPPDLFAEADAVHVSVAFTWDLPAAEQLAEAWRAVAPVTIGGPATRDTLPAAHQRLQETVAAGFTPMAMLWRDRHGQTAADWRRLQREWVRPAIIHAVR